MKIPTVSEALADERLLRGLAGMALADQSSVCQMWLDYGGSLPDTRPIEVVVAALTKKCKPWDLVDSIGRVSGIRRMKKDSYNEFTGRWFSWWIFQTTPTQQAICALVALGLVRVDDGGGKDNG